MKPLVLYHGNCPDGFCSAWLFHSLHFHSLHESAEYVAVNYGESPPETRDREVYILDFSYKRDVMRSIIDKANRVVVLDHHKTAQADLAGLAEEYAPRGQNLPMIVFDMEHSGARLTHDYLTSKWSVQPRPWLVDYVEDRDLWKFKLERSKEISAFLRSHPYDFATWDTFHDMMLEDAIIQYGDLGEAILRSEQRTIEAHVAQAYMWSIGGYNVPVVNATTLQSEIAGALAETHAFGACYIDKFGERVWSLRSRGDFDVSEIAAKFGGGGHKNAAGFKQKLEVPLL